MPALHAHIIAEAAYMKAWENYTCHEEPCTEADLMQRAATAFLRKILSFNAHPLQWVVLAGPGNNGGDGFFIARLLLQEGYRPEIYFLPSLRKRPPHIEQCIDELIAAGLIVQEISDKKNFPLLSADTIVIDALFGVGLNRPLSSVAAELVMYLIAAEVNCWSVDIPSGMGSDQYIIGPSVRAQHTIGFESLKPAFLLAQNWPMLGKLDVVPIGLSPNYPLIHPSDTGLITEETIREIFRPRQGVEHKGHFGHSFLVAGSEGKMGAAVLAAKACLRSGTGLLTVLIPEKYTVELLTALPEAMQLARENGLPKLEPYRSIGMGPGMGLDADAEKLLVDVLKKSQVPLVLDADALHLLSLHPEHLSLLPEGTLLTPHPKEFDRLFGKHSNEYERSARARQVSQQNPWVIILKGHHTQVCYGGKSWFNSTGNAGLAKGGSGDVLTGILTALLAQQYDPLQAALLGVYLHGLAADIAVNTIAQESLLASDVIDSLGKAFQTLY